MLPEPSNLSDGGVIWDGGADKRKKPRQIEMTTSLIRTKIVSVELVRSLSFVMIGRCWNKVGLEGE